MKRILAHKALIALVFTLGGLCAGCRTMGAKGPPFQREAVPEGKGLVVTYSVPTLQGILAPTVKWMVEVDPGSKVRPLEYTYLELGGFVTWRGTPGTHVFSLVHLSPALGPEGKSVQVEAGKVLYLRVGPRGFFDGNKYELVTESEALTELADCRGNSMAYQLDDLHLRWRALKVGMSIEEVKKSIIEFGLFVTKIVKSSSGSTWTFKVYSTTSSSAGLGGMHTFEFDALGKLTKWR